MLVVAPNSLMKMAGPLDWYAELMDSRVMSCSAAAVSSDWRHSQQVGRVAGQRAAVAAVDVEVEDQPLERHRAQL